MAGAEEERDREAVAPRRRGDDPVDRGPQVAVGGEFEEFADIDDEAPLHRLGGDPAVPPLDFEAALPVLDQQREEAAILVGADALLSLRGLTAGIADDLDVLVGARPGR